MRLIKRDLIFGIFMCALVFSCALAWGGPFVKSDPGPAPARAAQQVRPAPEGYNHISPKNL
ncbi:MAG: hypothetical protein ACRD27_10010 [Terracidiphilus sp.]